jgi:hypothetical protein
MIIVFGKKPVSAMRFTSTSGSFLSSFPAFASNIVITTRNYYTGGISAAKRLLRGMGW